MTALLIVTIILVSIMFVGDIVAILTEEAELRGWSFINAIFLALAIVTLSIALGYA